jgi:hypothetical protein
MLATLRFIFAAVALATLCRTSIASEVASPPPADTSPHCTAAEYRQLDFWIGDWDTFEAETPEGPSIARARIEPIAAGCALHELYEQSDGLIGDSILSYDAVRKQWQQTWVTNRGALMVLWGDFKDGALVLEGDVHLHDGRTVRQRITWTTQGDAVRESAVSSKDGGKSWAPAFDVVFRKRSAPSR